MCVDDDPNSMPSMFPYILVLPYIADYGPEDDKEMLRVLDNIAPNTDERNKALHDGFSDDVEESKNEDFFGIRETEDGI